MWRKAGCAFQLRMDIITQLSGLLNQNARHPLDIYAAQTDSN
jgi:hypothetical protein